MVGECLLAHCLLLVPMLAVWLQHGKQHDYLAWKSPTGSIESPTLIVLRL